MAASPVPVAELKRPVKLPDVNEYGIKYWLESVKQLLDNADAKWQRCQQKQGPPTLAEEAYRDWRKVAEIMSKLHGHRDYSKMVSQKLPLLYSYYDLRDRIIHADTHKQILAYLEKREAEWHRTHSSPSSPHQSNGNGTISESPPAPVSLQDRIAALRSKGLATGTSRPAPPHQAATESNPSPPRPTPNRMPSAPSVVKDDEPTRIASDQVEDAAQNRTGSVPPSIEASLKSLQLQDAPAPSETMPPPPRQETTPVDFGAHFPSLEQLEQQFSSAQPVPSVNGSGPTRPPLPIPPKPADLQRADKPKPPTSSSRPKLPFTNEVMPRALWDYLQAMLADQGGSRALLLDVRPRHEFERARIMGESVCIEPVTLRKGVTSAEIESSLSVSPKRELEMFEARHTYDVVIVYDKSSQSAPNFAPPSTAPEAQRILWSLTDAIYEHEFHKSLQRQPVLLKGGWEAWEREIGSKGIIGSDAKEIEAREKRNHRQAAVIPDQSGTTMLRTNLPPASMDLQPPAYASPLTPFQSPYSGAAPARLTMPSPALQRSGSSPAFDYQLARPHYPQQPLLNGSARPDYGDQYSQSYDRSAYGSGSIEYPNLRSPTSSTTTATRPPVPTSIPYTPSQLQLARPPAAQPAPDRASYPAYPAMPAAARRASSSRYTLETIRFGNEGIGLTGLKNFGNTCYMNSTLQCLSATIPFARYFREGLYKRDVNVTNKMGTKGAIADAVAELIRAMWAQNYTFLAPVTFREKITQWAPQFKGSDQHDAQEFLGFLLDGLHEDLNLVTKKPPPVEMSPEREYDLEHVSPQIMSEREWSIYRRRDDSFIVQCFQGQFRNQLRCLTCGQTSTTYNTFMPLSIPIPNIKSSSRTKVTLLDCIAQFVREEILDKDEKWLCPRCKVARKASKRLTLSRLPPVLVIQLKRFSFHGPFSDKIETVVQYPLERLDLSPFLPPSMTSQRPPRDGWLYDLYGVVNHYGNLSSGHYTAYVRNNKSWNNIGDSKVTENVDPKFVESAPSAYILFYRIRES